MMNREKKTYHLDRECSSKSYPIIDYVRYYRMVEKGFQKYNFYVRDCIYIEREQLPRELPTRIYIKEGGYDD